MNPAELQAALALFNAALPIGEDVVIGVKALLSRHYGADYPQIEAIWAANIAEATKNAEGK